MTPSTDRLELLRREGAELTREAHLLRSQCKVSRTQMAYSCAELRDMVERAKARNNVILERYEDTNRVGRPLIVAPVSAGRSQSKGS